MRTTRPSAALAVALALSAAAAWAQPPTPLDLAGYYPFPGAVQGPASAVSAGLALADRWLGDEPFDNPSAPAAREVSLSPVFLRVSRQDLRAHNSQFDETSGFLDAAGGRLSWPVGRVALSLYAYQPVLRREDNAFTRGRPGESITPATVKSSSTSRELRTGLAISFGRPALRVGVAGEWTHREDAYDYQETSGDPASGTRHAEFSGDGFGAQAGVGYAPVDRLWVGAGLRWVPSLDLTGRQHEELLTGTSSSDVSARRKGALEGGVSARVAVTDAFRVLVSGGGQGAESWDGLGVTAGAGATWAAGLDFHDERDPWTARLGVGQSVQRGVPEPRATAVGLGFGWNMESFALDVAVLRRSFQRVDKPTSFDDRVVAGLRVPF